MILATDDYKIAIGALIRARIMVWDVGVPEQAILEWGAQFRA